MKEHGLRRLGFDLFHKAFRWISDFPITMNTGVFALLDRSTVNEFVKLTESSRFIPGLRSRVGFEQRIAAHDHQNRASGNPKLSLLQEARYADDG